MKNTPFIFVVLIVLSLSAFSQEEPSSETNLYEMSLEELMNIKISVASKNATSNIRETPGSITTISRSDIEQSGARDLLEILQRLVPGFSFGSDVEGVVGVGIRGLWAHEGKVLLMIDGKSINDEQFATTQFGNHINADVIEKIEIIRGPGSSIYGGYAELGVINIITRRPTDGGYVSIKHSAMSNTFSHKNISAGAGIEKNDVRMSLNMAYNRGYRSQDTYRDFSGNDTSFLNTNEVNSMLIHTDLEWKGLQVSYLLDKYEITTMDLWGTFSPIAYNEKWDTHVGDLRYNFEVGKFKIAPYVKYKYQLPWHTDMIPEEYTNRKSAHKATAGLVAKYSITENIDVDAGVEGYEHKLVWPDEITNYEELARSGANQMSIKNFSSFAEAKLKTSWVNFMGGIRFDAFNEFGTSFVPRIAATKVIGDFHFKGMFSGSFRTPGGIIPNRTYDIDTKIKPEKGLSFELEAGATFFGNSWLTLNGFYHDLNDVIVYQTDGSIGFYGNGGNFGSSGLEISYRFISDLMRLNVNGSYYLPVNAKDIDYIVPGHKNYYLGFSNIRLNANASIKVYEGTFVNFGGRFYGVRYGIVGETILGDPLVQKDDPMLFLDINFKKNNILFDDLNASIGINNILDQQFIYYQAYNGGHAGLPSLGRSLVINIEYKF